MVDESKCGGRVDAMNGSWKKEKKRDKTTLGHIDADADAGWLEGRG